MKIISICIKNQLKGTLLGLVLFLPSYHLASAVCLDDAIADIEMISPVTNDVVQEIGDLTFRFRLSCRVIRTELYIGELGSTDAEDRWMTGQNNPSNSDEGTIVWNVARLENGWHKIRITVNKQNPDIPTQSLFVNQVIFNIFLIKDFQNPSLTIFSPSAGGTYRDDIVLKGLANDDVGLKRVEVQFDDNAPILLREAADLNIKNKQWILSWKGSIDDIGEGQHKIIVRAWDQVNKNVQETIYFTVDKTFPEVSILAPPTDVDLSGEINIIGTASDNFEIVYVEFSIDGTPIGRFEDPPYEINKYDTTQLDDGDHFLDIIVLDRAGFVSRANQVLRILNHPEVPIIRLISPEDQAHLRGLVTVSAIVTDDRGLDEVQLKFDGETLYTFTEVSCCDLTLWEIQYEFETSGGVFADGSHDLVMIAKDVNKASSTLSVEVTVDNTFPTVILQTPREEQIRRGLFGAIPLTVKALDDNLKDVKFILNDRTLTQFTEPPFEYILDTLEDEFPDGDYSLNVEAVDWAGNKSEVTRVFRIINEAPPRSAGLAQPSIPDQTFVTNSDLGGLAVSFSKPLLLTQDFDQAIQLFLVEGNYLKLLEGSVELLNSDELHYQGEIPENSVIEWRVRVKDEEGALYNETFNFILPLGRDRGGRVFAFDKKVSMEFAPYSLPIDLLIQIEDLEDKLISAPQESPFLTRIVQGAKIISGPYLAFGLDQDGNRVQILERPATLRFEIPPADLPLEEKPVIIEVQQWLEQASLWKTIKALDVKKLEQLRGTSLSSFNLQISIDNLSYFRVISRQSPESTVSNFINFPNPFNPFKTSTSLSYFLEQDSHVDIIIYDLLGRLVKKWEFSPSSVGGLLGENIVSWDGRNGEGKRVGDGGYIVQVTAEDVNGNVAEQRIKIGVVK